jgi:quinol monooxygenase YgiN
MTINIIATVQALPGKEEQVLAALRTVLAPTRAEAGNLRYELYRSEARPDCFTFVEKFVDAQAYALHQSASYLAVLGAALDGLLAQAPSIEQQSEVLP